MKKLSLVVLALALLEICSFFALGWLLQSLPFDCQSYGITAEAVTVRECHAEKLLIQEINYHFAEGALRLRGVMVLGKGKGRFEGLPELPDFIKKIELTGLDLGALKIASFDHVSRLVLKRIEGEKEFDWKLWAILAGKRQVSGKIGKALDLEVYAPAESWTFPKLKLAFTLRAKLRSDHFGKKELFVQDLSAKLSEVFYAGQKLNKTPWLVISDGIVLAGKDFQLKKVDSSWLTGEGLELFTGNGTDLVLLKAPAPVADRITQIFVPALKLRAGNIAGSIGLDWSDLIKSQVYFHSENLAASWQQLSLNDLQVDFDNATAPYRLKLTFRNQPLSTLVPPSPKIQKIQGLLNGQITLPEMSGNIDLKGGLIAAEGLELQGITGKAFIDHAKLKSKLSFSLNGNPALANITARLSPKLNGQIQITSPKLNLTGLPGVDPKLIPAGELQNLNCTLALNTTGLKLVSCQSDGAELALETLFAGELQRFQSQSGKLSLTGNILKLAAVKLSDENGNQIDLAGVFDIASKQVKDLALSANFELASLKEIFKNFNPPELKGAVEARLLVEAGKLKDVFLSVQELEEVGRGLKGNFSLEGQDTSALALQGDFSLPFASRFVLEGLLGLPNAPLEELGTALSFSGELDSVLHYEDFLTSDFLTILKPLLKREMASGLALSSSLNKASNDPNWQLKVDSGERIALVGSYDMEELVLDLSRLKLSFNGLNVEAKGRGDLENFALEAYTAPSFDLTRFFADSSFPISGELFGKMKSDHIDLSDLKSILKNLHASIQSPKERALVYAAATLRGLTWDFESKDGEGYSALFVQEGEVKELPFKALKASLKLVQDRLTLESLGLESAQGSLDLYGALNLETQDGIFSGKAQGLEVGEIARGLFGEKGFSGKGNFTFLVDGHLLSLLTRQDAVFASGTFALTDGHVASVNQLERQLNLGNLILGGPLALNTITMLETFAPRNEGFYRSLSGEWLIDKELVRLPRMKYRGVSELTLNAAGGWNRATDWLEFNFIGSIPRIPVRVNELGQVAPISNFLSKLQPSFVLQKIGLVDPRPRSFAFSMKGPLSEAARISDSASNTFRFVDFSGGELPLPKEPRLDQFELRPR